MLPRLISLWTTIAAGLRAGVVAYAWFGLCAVGPVLAAGANPPARPDAGYVPAPQPVDTGRYLIGAVMCPLWQGGRRWADLTSYPERKPALGWYDEGDPEVTDWEITWALDHGISFFMVCWYRAKDNFAEPTVRPALEHWLHEGLPRSRYGDRFKFAIMWENANKQYANPTSETDFLTKLVPFWIENYFRRANYLVLDGQPVFSIYNPEKFVRELGGEAPAAAAIAAMRAACVRAGFKGLQVLGQYCWGQPAKLRELAGVVARSGMDASWAYHWPTFTGAFGTNLRPSGAEAIVAQERQWQTQPPPHVLTLSMGWDSRPWRSSYSKVQWRLTPAEFATLCRRAKTLLDQRPVGGLESRLVLLDNWNEFGEGHYIAPTREFGFGYLDAVREVFAPEAAAHRDVTPDELGRGPYDSQFRQWLAKSTPEKKS